MKNNDLIALAAFLHDIGKFGQRAEIEIKDFDWQTYCPNYKGYYSHKHAAYTAKILGDLIVEKQKEEKRIVKADSLNGKFIDIASNHHKPETNEEWIVAVADRLASGFERDIFDDYNDQMEEDLKKSYKEQQLNHLFQKEKFPLDILSPKNIFPTKEKGKGYKKLWEDFEKELKVINEKISNFPEHIKANALEFLLKKYTSFIPSATSFRSKNGITISSISLYEHLKTTSVFASAIVGMNEENKQNILRYYQAGDKNGELSKKVFLLIAGDFFGIQNFIFDEVQSKFAAKTLRAKSAYIQILVRVLAYYICQNLGISKYSIISTHAGKFEILVPNESEIIEKLKEIQKEFNNYFSEHFFGLTGVGITWVEAAIEDFLIRSEKENRYKKLRKNLADKVEEIKFQKFGLFEKGYEIFEIDDELDNQNLCNFCNKRKGDKKEYYVICEDCEKFVKIGQALTKNKFMAISEKEKDKKDIKIFDKFYLHFFDHPSKNKAQNDIAIFDIRIDENFEGFEKWELSSYVATKEDFKEYEQFLINKNEEFFKSDILTLEELAALSIKEGIKKDKREEGVEAIIALKGDGDGMGNFIKTSDVTNSFAKYNFFARMIDYYFSVYVPIEFMQEKPLYTVFAGGDDLFVLGAWDEVIKLASKVRDDFKKFTSNKLSFSVGLTMSKANKPINFLAHITEEALEEAKDFCCIVEKNGCKEIVKDKENLCDKDDKNIKKKDALTLFDESVRWESYKKVKDDFKQSFKHPKGKEFKTTFLYRLIDIANMSKEVNCDGNIKATIWKSKLSYLYTRNISDTNFTLLNFLDTTIQNYPKEFKLVLFEYIYKRRKN